MNIGCTALIEVHEGQFVGIDCAKARGIILPGGKWEKPETFHACALRELKEEVGIRGQNPYLIFGGMSVDNFFVYTFLVMPEDWNEVWRPYESAEGKKVTASWDDLFDSRYEAYYKVLKDVYDSYRALRNLSQNGCG